MTASIRPMTDAQFEALRDLGLTMTRTLLDGSLVVVDDAGDVWELGPAGDLLPHVQVTTVRVNPADL